MIIHRFLGKMSGRSGGTNTSAQPKANMPKKATSPIARASKLFSPAEDIGGKVLCRWRPNRGKVELVAMQGDLTACKADAIVNAANTRLMHGGGLAGAIVRNGGSFIQKESSKWIKDHGSLKVGDAVTTAAGKLPCKHVIHTVGPNVGNKTPTEEDSALLRRAVWNALMEANRLKLKSVAVPGISTGIFGYPRDSGALEIVRESARFCKEKEATTKLRCIALMNIDDPTVESFVKAVKEERGGETTTEDAVISEQLAGLNIRD